jgi:hypothetical protein
VPRNDGSSIGERLIDAAVAHASGDVEQIQLAVVTENEAARRLYVKAGFIEYGHQINALKHGGRYYDDILMVRFLGQKKQPGLDCGHESGALPLALAKCFVRAGRRFNPIKSFEAG